MSLEFNADEILAMAEEIERSGCRFYQEAARGVADPIHKSFLMDLSRMEEEHEQTFLSMRKALSTEDCASNLFDPEDESAVYLKALADLQVFNKKDIDRSSLTEILKSALLAEKDSILFYTGMKDLLPSRIGSEQVDAIIREERSHVVLLTQKLMQAG